jgi:hypothetical protein
MPEYTVPKSIVSVSKNILHSNILRVGILLSLLTIYSVLLSPKVEDFFVTEISSSVRGASTVEVNSLTPIFDIHIYAGEYNLSSSFSQSSTSSRTKFFTLDPRVLALNRFLLDYHSPMAKDAEVFVTAADEYGLDWRLIVSISGVESAFGNLVPRDSNNGWGWRGINGNEAGWSMFNTWEEGITHITERMAIGYGTDLTPLDIQDTYCPPCGATGQDLWAKGVIGFMNELEYYVNNLETL